ncbi:MAG: ABC transporter substrate-binding protein [Deinococcales bacterium]
MKRLILTVGVLATMAALSLGFAQKSGGTLIAAWAQDPVGLDPQIASARSSLEVLENVVDKLVALDAQGKVIPSLATSWEVSSDGLTWTFHLRHDVKFSNGRPMTAKDVVYTYTRMLDPATGSGQKYLLGSTQSVTAPDDYTVQFHLKTPNVALVAHLAAQASVGIIAKESVDNGTINTQPIGTGPFMIADYQPGTEVVLKKNPYYWQKGLPYLNEVDIKIISDESVRQTALISGDVDWAISVPAQSLSQLRNDPNIVVDKTSAGAYWYIGVNLKNQYLKNPKVREAINYAINRKDITDAMTFGTGVPTQDPIPSSSAWAFNYAPYSYDPAKAKQLLTEAGYPDGFRMQIMPTTQYAQSVRGAQVIQQELAQVGIKVTIKNLEWAQWLQQEGKGNYDTYVCSWNGLVDPYDFFYAQQRTGQVFNFTGYSNPQVDKLLDEGNVTQGFAQRKAIYQQVNKMVVDDAPYIYLYNPANIQAYQTYVKGYAARPDQNIDFVKTWLDK